MIDLNIDKDNLLYTNILENDSIQAKPAALYGETSKAKIIQNAIDSIPSEIFISQASRVLMEFHEIVDTLCESLEVNFGNCTTVKNYDQKLINNFNAIALTANASIERILGDSFDGGGKMALASANRRIQILASGLENGSRLSGNDIREIRMGVDFLMLGIKLIQ